MFSALGDTLLPANHLIGQLLHAVESSGNFYLLLLIKKGFSEELFRWIALRMRRTSRRTREAFELPARNAVSAVPAPEAGEEETAL